MVFFVSSPVERWPSIQWSLLVFNHAVKERMEEYNNGAVDIDRKLENNQGFSWNS